MLEYELGNELFEKTFPIIQTDNGTEFGDPLSLEFNDEGIGRTRIFYCNIPKKFHPTRFNLHLNY